MPSFIVSRISLKDHTKLYRLAACNGGPVNASNKRGCGEDYNTDLVSSGNINILQTSYYIVPNC